MGIPSSSLNAPRSRPTGVRARFPAIAPTLEALTLFLYTAFFLFYGLVPIFGGAGLGLVGADEPRYAQIGHEMLEKLDQAPSLVDRLNACVTPMLYGQPWLEKPALYYWRAMFAFKEFGVHDWSARLPSASFAFVLCVLAYLHIRRFRPGGQLDAALITASCAGILAFARGASTDMQLAAPFCIGMLGWYAWYETDSKFWLFDLYFFGGAATLAKGPVAPFLAAIIILAFAALRKEWSIIRRTFWLPGVVLYLAMVLPWFIAVQHRNPEFFNIFFLEHNLQRFSTNRFQHREPFWYYLPIMGVALMPWAVIAVTALVDAARESINEWRARRTKNRYIGHPRAGDAFPEFLVLWALLPVFFFSLSKSKLPGYILPSVPPITILTADYLNRIRHRGLKPWLLNSHAVVTGLMTAIVLMLPWHIVHPDVMPPTVTMAAAIATGIAAAFLIMFTVTRFGVHRLRVATTTPIVILLIFIFGFGPFFGLADVRGSKLIVTLLDETYSARPLSQELLTYAPASEAVAVYRVRRDMEYGLSFYRNRRVANYADRINGVPPKEHLLVVRESYVSELSPYLNGRSYEQLFTYPAQGLLVYKVAAK